MLDGILVVNKPKGIVSHRVVQLIRRIFPGTKIGHLGTLDPLASGVLPIMFGFANRLHRLLIINRKEYIAKLLLGRETDTYDSLGNFTSEYRKCDKTLQDIESVAKEFEGKSLQTPPAFSAVKINGKPSYKYARDGINVELPEKEVEIYSVDLISFNVDELELRVSCSTGTYIRTLVHDIGKRLGCGAHLTDLTRTRVGDFKIEDSIKLEEIDAERLTGDYFIKLEELLPWLQLGKIQDNEDLSRLLNGNSLNIDRFHISDKKDFVNPDIGEKCYLRIFFNDKLAGIGVIEGDSVSPKIMFRDNFK